MRLKVYFGKVCAKHPELKGERNLASRNCSACCLEVMRRWRAENPAVKRALARRWRGHNKAYQAQRCRAWHAENQEYNAKRCREYRRLKKEKEQQCAI